MAGWRYRVGASLNVAKHALLASRALPLNRYVPPGLSWLYDVQRIAGTRRFDVILDVGANVGQTAWGLVRYFPDARIHCFEPVAATFDVLKQRYGRRPNVTLVQKALGAQAGETTIRLCVDSERNTLVPGGASGAPLTERSETISIDTVDAYCAAQGIGEIDVLKLDVQGWEIEVLRGMSLRPRFIFAEVGFRRDQDDMQFFSSFHEQMAASHYEFGGLYDSFRHGPGKGFVGFANALYVDPTRHV